MNSIVNHNACHALKEAWSKVNGVKRAVWGSIGLFALICVGGFSILGCAMMYGGITFIPNFSEMVSHPHSLIFAPATIKLSTHFFVFALIYFIAQSFFEFFILLPMRLGALLISLRRAVDKSVSPLFIFAFFTMHYIGQFIFLQVSIMFIVFIPTFFAFLFFSIPIAHHFTVGMHILFFVIGILFSMLTIYLAVGYIFSAQLIIDRNIGAWPAMRLSLKAATKRWFCIFGTLIWLAIVLVASALLLFFGLIWTVPYALNVIALLYRDMLGIEGKDPVTQKELRGSIK